MTTREEPASRCRRRRDETDGGHQCDEACDCEEEEENCQEEEELIPDNSSSQQEFMRVIGLQSSHRVKARLSCTQEALEQELEDGECEASVGDESMEETSVCSGDSENECPDMLAIGGNIYHLSEVTDGIINTMTPEERHIYDTLMADYDDCQ